MVRSGPVWPGLVRCGAVRSDPQNIRSVLRCFVYNSNVKKESLLQDAVENNQSGAIFALQNILF